MNNDNCVCGKEVCLKEQCGKYKPDNSRPIWSISDKPIWGIADKAYVVNLDKDTQRLAEITQRLAKLEIPFTRIPGIDVTEMPAEIRGMTQPGCYGCAMSHLKVFKQIQADDVDVALILEDDAVFRDDAAIMLEAIAVCDLSKIDWDVCYLGVQANQIGRQLGSSVWELVHGLTTHAYAVKKTALPTLIEWTESLAWLRGGSHTGGRFWDAFPPVLKRVFVRPALVIQKPSYSNVGRQYIDRTNVFFQNDEQAKQQFFDACDEARNGWRLPAPEPVQKTATFESSAQELNVKAEDEAMQ